jgi:hypothetical protein
VARERKAEASSLGWNIPGSEQRTAARRSGEWQATRKRDSWFGESEVMAPRLSSVQWSSAAGGPATRSQSPRESEAGACCLGLNRLGRLVLARLRGDPAEGPATW